MQLSRAQFARSDVALPEPSDGEVLIRNMYFACDPMNHAWVKGLGDRFAPIPAGAPMCGGTVGRVVESRHTDFAVGEVVSGFLEFADYVTSPSRDRLGVRLQRLPPDLDPASGLATLGMTGLCAYLGMTDIGRPAAGETVLVSGAAGAIGTVAGQIARIAGARVIGIAGGSRKCTMLADALGFDATIDYKSEQVAERMAALCPDGIDVFFDNVGGVILDTALTQMARGGRIVICGGISGYNGEFAGLQNHLMLAIRGCTMAGFYYFDLEDRFPEGVSRMAEWLRSGAVREVLDISPGFESLPEAALGQFFGSNIGKQLVRICDPATLVAE